MENLWPSRRWLIIPTSITSSINFNQVIESDIEGLKCSNDQSKTFIKYDVNVITASYTQSWVDPVTHQSESILIPSGTYGRPDIYPQGLSEHDYPSILNILSTPEWYSTGSL
jgi:hypothetical protein